MELFLCSNEGDGKKYQKEKKITHHFHSTEDMAEMVAAFQILGNISKCAEVIWVLSGAGNVPDLMLSHYSLVGQREKNERWPT